LIPTWNIIYLWLYFRTKRKKPEELKVCLMIKAVGRVRWYDDFSVKIMWQDDFVSGNKGYI
jgi:hypothetical protein